MCVWCLSKEMYHFIQWMGVAIPFCQYCLWTEFSNCLLWPFSNWGTQWTKQTWSLFSLTHFQSGSREIPELILVPQILITAVASASAEQYWRLGHIPWELEVKCCKPYCWASKNNVFKSTLSFYTSVKQGFFFAHPLVILYIFILLAEIL